MFCICHFNSDAFLIEFMLVRFIFECIFFFGLNGRPMLSTHSFCFANAHWANGPMWMPPGISDAISSTHYLIHSKHPRSPIHQPLCVRCPCRITQWEWERKKNTLILKFPHVLTYIRTWLLPHDLCEWTSWVNFVSDRQLKRVEATFILSKIYCFRNTHTHIKYFLKTLWANVIFLFSQQ